ncbi:MAG TPA: bifunctional 4-hydroxy-2-oxoglutarate aldolase/2-dehydro-3-deoxy-phosphogluconate aldolase [Steroidobacteraceae bacterium]|nr:bifunctional 4-hydroxy-2-oxoglutarate aldolase/2-dehydro-3-deoxy-phosphogluconate aldolase [Steroidobacteraceae bacterium]
MVTPSLSELIGRTPVIPVLELEAAEEAVPLARALHAGGLSVLELSLRSAVTLLVLESLRRELPQVCIGVGPLIRAVDFAAAGRAGAHFGVTAGLTSELAAAARGARFPVMPGVMTPSEVIAARQAGFAMLALFPAEAAGGVALAHALGRAFPDVALCPHGSLDAARASEYLALANVPCVAGEWIAPPKEVRTGDWSGLEQRAHAAAVLGRAAS